MDKDFSSDSEEVVEERDIGELSEGDLPEDSTTAKSKPQKSDETTLTMNSNKIGLYGQSTSGSLFSTLRSSGFGQLAEFDDSDSEDLLAGGEGWKKNLEHTTSPQPARLVSRTHISQIAQSPLRLQALPTETNAHQSTGKAGAQAELEEYENDFEEEDDQFIIPTPLTSTTPVNVETLRVEAPSSTFSFDDDEVLHENDDEGLTLNSLLSTTVGAIEGTPIATERSPTSSFDGAASPPHEREPARDSTGSLYGLGELGREEHASTLQEQRERPSQGAVQHSSEGKHASKSLESHPTAGPVAVPQRAISASADDKLADLEEELHSGEDHGGAKAATSQAAVPARGGSIETKLSTLRKEVSERSREACERACGAEQYGHEADDQLLHIKAIVEEGTKLEAQSAEHIAQIADLLAKGQDELAKLLRQEGEVVRLQEENAQLTARVDDLEEAMQTTLDENEHLRRKLEDTLGFLQRLKMEEEEEKGRVGARDEQLSSISEQLEAERARIQAIEKERQREQEIISVQRRQIDELSNANQLMEVELVELRHAVAQANEAVRLLHVEAAENKQRITEYERAQLEHHQHVARLEDLLQDARASLENAEKVDKSALVDLQGRLRNSEQRETELRRRLDEEKERRANREAEIDVLQRQLVAASREKAEKDETIARLSSAIQALEEEVEELKLDKFSLQEKLDAVKSPQQSPHHIEPDQSLLAEERRLRENVERELQTLRPLADQNEMLQRRLAELESVLATLRPQAIALESERQRLTQQVSALEDRLAVAATENTRLQSECERFLNEKQREHSTAVQALQTQLATQQRKKEELELQLQQQAASYEERLKAAQQQYSELAQEKAQLASKSTAALQEQREVYEKQLADMRVRIASLEEAVAEKNRQLEQRNASMEELARASHSATNEYAAKLQHLSRQKEEAEKVIAELRQQLSSHREELMAVSERGTNEMREWQQRLRDAERKGAADAARWRTAWEEEKARGDELAKKVEQLEADLAAQVVHEQRLRRQLDDERQRRAAAEAKVQQGETEHALHIEQLTAQANSEVAALRAKLQAKEAELAEAKRLHAATVDEVQQVTRKVNDYAAQLERAQTEGEQMGQLVQRLRREHNEAIEKLRTAAEEMRQLQDAKQRERVERDALIDAAQRRLDEVQRQAEESARELQRVAAENLELKARITALGAELDMQRATAMQREEEHNKELAQQRAAAEEQARRHEATMARVQESWASMRAELEASREALTKQVEELKMELVKVKAAERRADEGRAEAEARLREAIAERDVLTAQLESARIERDDAARIRREYERKAEEAHRRLERELQEAAAEREKLALLLDEARKSRATLDASLRQKEEELARVRRELEAQLQAERDHYAQLRRTADAEADQLKHKMDEVVHAAAALQEELAKHRRTREVAEEENRILRERLEHIKLRRAEEDHGVMNQLVAEQREKERLRQRCTQLERELAKATAVHEDRSLVDAGIEHLRDVHRRQRETMLRAAAVDENSAALAAHYKTELQRALEEVKAEADRWHRWLAALCKRIHPHGTAASTAELKYVVEQYIEEQTIGASRNGNASDCRPVSASVSAPHWGANSRNSTLPSERELQLVQAYLSMVARLEEDKQALIQQKNFLMRLLEGYSRAQDETLEYLAAIGSSKYSVGGRLSHGDLTKPTSYLNVRSRRTTARRGRRVAFRWAVLAVIAAYRLRSLVNRRARSTQWRVSVNIMAANDHVLAIAKLQQLLALKDSDIRMLRAQLDALGAVREQRLRLQATTDAVLRDLGSENQRLSAALLSERVSREVAEAHAVALSKRTRK